MTLLPSTNGQKGRKGHMKVRYEYYKTNHKMVAKADSCHLFSSHQKRTSIWRIREEADC